MAINTQIPQDKWKDFFASFSNGNRGRPLIMEVLGAEFGDSRQTGEAKLFAVD